MTDNQDNFTEHLLVQAGEDQLELTRLRARVSELESSNAVLTSKLSAIERDWHRAAEETELEARLSVRSEFAFLLRAGQSESPESAAQRLTAERDAQLQRLCEAMAALRPIVECWDKSDATVMIPPFDGSRELFEAIAVARKLVIK